MQPRDLPRGKPVLPYDGLRPAGTYFDAIAKNLRKPLDLPAPRGIKKVETVK